MLPVLRTAGAIAIAAAIALVAAAPATAQDERLVTYAWRARARPARDIAANLARNNIQESLRDLGADTLYVGGEPIAQGRRRP
jgi:hypothetical protein